MTTSRLQNEHPFPGDTVPQYRYATLWSTDGMGVIDSYLSAGAGDMSFTELTTGSLAAPEFDASTDSHAMLTELPYDVDVNAPIDFRVLWSSTETSADVYTFDLLYREIVLNTTTANTLPAGTLDTAIAADTGSTTADALQYTPWGTLNGGTLSGTQPDYLLHLLVDPSSFGGTISAEVVLLWAVQIRYMPKML